ncbi:hypothetical protein AB0L22_09230 [Micromonospora haikouensis]|uniref:hypothetical protein n=1 Tax=Micromonospora haikouensis TaxID=686309 RepID=UPI00343DFB6E
MTPTVERHFAAVRITTGSHTYHLNRGRLLDAIRILSEPHTSSAAKALRDIHPTLAPGDTYDYLCAAQTCIDYNIQP